MDIERRIVDAGVKIETRAEGEGRLIRGHAAVFDRLSENLGGFRERIAPGAFDGVLGDDVRALYNHDPNHILGRTTAGTLRVGVDERGLTYEVEPPDTQVARDLLVSIGRGDVTQSSFGFSVADDDWEQDEEGRDIRVIYKIRRLYDVSPVTYPAYQDATVALRLLERWRAKHPKPTFDRGAHRRRMLRLADLY